MGFIGFVLMLQGFGSTIAVAVSDAEGGPLMRWAHEYQPYAGIVLGLLGIAVLMLGERRKSNSG